jgi:glutathione S-transferase
MRDKPGHDSGVCGENGASARSGEPRNDSRKKHPMLTVHHLAHSQSERVVWLCEELAIPYELKRYERDATGLAPTDYKALHPCQTAPTITDGALALGETGAVFEYILNKYGQGKLIVASSSPDYADYLFWLYYAMGTMHPRTVTQLVLDHSGVGDSLAAQSCRAQLDRAYQMMESRLGEADYLGGPEFTAADIMAVFVVTSMRNFVKRELGPYPNIRSYLQRIGARPAYQRAMKKSEPNRPLLLS